MYDGDDRLREAIGLSGQGREVYYYDHNGQRVLAARVTGAAWLERIRFWFGETEIWYHPTGEVEKTLVHIPLGEVPVARVENANPDDVELTYTGILGHLLAAAGTSGALGARFGYGPYGEILYAKGDAAGEHTRRFHGKELDPLTRLGYYGFRYYDRLSLTWTQADPLYRFAPDLAYDEPRRTNLYTFVLSNPLRYVDPNGLDGDGDGPRDASNPSDVDLGDFESWRDKVIDTRIDENPGSAPSGKEYAGLSVYIEWRPDDPTSRQWYALWQPINGAANGVPDSKLNAVQSYIRRNLPTATVNPDTLKALDGLALLSATLSPLTGLARKAIPKLAKKAFHRCVSWLRSGGPRVMSNAELASVRGGAMSRKAALTRMEGLSAQVEKHLAKLADDPANLAIGHWRKEITTWLGDMEKVLPAVGKKTAAKWQAKLTAWRQALGE